MAFDSPPGYMDGTTLDAEVFRRAIGSMIGSAGGIVTPGDLAVTQQSTPNMSVQIGVGQIWVPGTSTPTQGPYYSRNGAALTVPIAASNPSLPRIDTVICQVEDQAYAGASKLFQAATITGTATSGATLSNLSGKGTLPASSYAIAYVLVPANATSIVTADIANVAAVVGSAQRLLISSGIFTTGTGVINNAGTGDWTLSALSTGSATVGFTTRAANPAVVATMFTGGAVNGYAEVINIGPSSAQIATLNGATAPPALLNAIVSFIVIG